MSGFRASARGALLLLAGVLLGPAACLTGTTTAASMTVLVVVAAPGSPTAGDQALVTRLAGLGFTATLADDHRVRPADAADHAFVLVAESSKPWLAAVRSLGSAGVPMLVARSQLYDDYGLTRPKAGTGYGTRQASSHDVVDPGHPLAAGLAGTVVMQEAGLPMSWGLPTDSATTVARLGARPTVFAVAAGDPLHSGEPAPACRVAFPASDAGVVTFTAAAWDMFDAAVAWLVDGCQAPAPPPPVDLPGEDVEHVVAISVDGLNPDAIAQLGAAGAPTFHRLLAEGATTLDARSMVERTRTLPNHTSMVTGHRIALPEGHGVSFNYDNGSTVHSAAGRYVPSVFDVVHDAGGTTAMYAGKSKFDLLDRSWNATTGAPDVTGADDGRDKIDAYLRHPDSGHLTDLLTASLSSNPASFSLFHFDDPDTAGHANGWLSPEYLAAVTAVDGWIGEVLDTVAGDPELAASTVVVITADHGGTSTRHDNAALAENYTIPFIVWGDGVTAGADLYALSPGRLDPGTGQPPYSDPVPPVRNGEVANLATGLLDLGPVPGSEVNADQDLRRSAP